MINSAPIPVTLITNRSWSDESIFAVITLMMIFPRGLPDSFVISHKAVLLTCYETKKTDVSDEVYYDFEKGIHDLCSYRLLRRVESPELGDGLVRYVCSKAKNAPVLSRSNRYLPTKQISRILRVDNSEFEPARLLRLYLFVLANRCSYRHFPDEIKGKFYIYPVTRHLAKFFCRGIKLKMSERTRQTKIALGMLVNMRLLKHYKLATRKGIRWEKGDVTDIYYRPDDEVYLAAMIHFLQESKQTRNRLTKMEYNPEHEVLFVTDEGKTYVGYDDFYEEEEES